jgi:excisionase family DNA binding protein
MTNRHDRPATANGQGNPPATNLAPICATIREALTPKEAAGILGVKATTIRAWCANGALSPVYDLGTPKMPRYRIPRETLLKKCEVVRPLIIN